jgi:aspartokinase
MSEDLRTGQETAFEKPRGVNRVEVRPGYAQVLLEDLPLPLSTSRIRVLKEVAEAGISVDFLKFTQTGLGFVIPQSQASAVEEAVSSEGPRLTIQTGRSIFLAHAVNMRDEEGLMAAIISEIIATGAPIDHMGDMHDRVLVVTDEPGSALMKDRVLAMSEEAWD